MFVDELTLHLAAGRGGNGVVRWRHEKGKEFGGPSGGNGGKGGDVYAVAVKDIGILENYRNKKEFQAGNGQPGQKDSKHGESGEDLELAVPVGTRLKNFESGHIIELTEVGQKELLLKGGRGGLGNEHFKASTNTRPKEQTDGEPGDEADFYIEVLLAVDVGLIGLPNAGKSSLLNALTRAKSKVGSFSFTTLEPALGDLYGIIIADIPGLIEGASEGKGLGHKFLRHIERTQALVHCVSAESDDVRRDYKVIRAELERYNPKISKKPEIVLLTKVDTTSEEDRESKLASLRGVCQDVFELSILDDTLVKAFSDYLTQRFK